MPYLRSACFLLALIAGCARNPSAPIGYADAWVRDQGGLTPEAAIQCRVDRVAAQLLRHCPDVRVRVHVLNATTPGAYSWPQGDIFVTRGLAALLTDDQLAAAIAHELGHLLGDGHVRAVVSLDGCGKPLGTEEQADLLGTRLLELAGLHRTLMIDMLRTLSTSPTLPGDCRRDLAHRIDRLAQVR